MPRQRHNLLYETQPGKPLKIHERYNSEGKTSAICDVRSVQLW